MIFDDHSEDNTFSVATQMAQKNPRIRCARMAKNYGSHALALFGFQQAQGDCAVLLVADLQDPPAAITEMIAVMQNGAHIVWHTRAKRYDPPLKKSWQSAIILVCDISSASATCRLTAVT